MKLLIIDEGWMVPYSFRKHIENTGIKTIVAGDTGQLPPVEEHPAYFIDGNVYHLSQLMRQAESNPIVYLARRARRGLPIFPGLYGANVFVCYDDEVNNDILRNANIVVCGRNATREDINNTVRREIIHTDSDVPIFGERMICKKNNWELAVNGISLANGLVGTVVRPPKVSNYDGKCFTMDFLPDLLNVPFIDVRCDYQFLNAPFKEKQMIKMSKYSVGEKFDYAYASTVHSCQGSEFMNGIYIEESLPNHGIQQNLDYTAITRFRNSLYLCKEKTEGILSGVLKEIFIMKQIENVYDAFINAWKSMAGYINKIGGDALRYAIGLPPAVFVINDIKNILGDKYQPYDIEFFEVDNTFTLKYAFHTIW